MKRPPIIPHLAEKEIYLALRDYAMDMDKCGVFNGGKGSILKSREAQGEVNCQDMSKKLATGLQSAHIIQLYAEYMDIGRTPATGFALWDICLLYETHIR